MVMVCNYNALINLSIVMMNLGNVLNTRLLAVLDTVSVNATLSVLVFGEHLRNKKTPPKNEPLQVKRDVLIHTMFVLISCKHTIEVDIDIMF